VGTDFIGDVRRKDLMVFGADGRGREWARKEKREGHDGV
jgi:hypothetical protein